MFRFHKLLVPLIAVIALAACQENGLPTAPVTPFTAEPPLMAATVVPVAQGVVAMTAEVYTTCAIDVSGTLSCWGYNRARSGAYGGQTDVPPDLGPVQQVSAADWHTCAVGSDGDVACWGQDYEGETRVPADLGPVTHVSAGPLHTCALKVDQSVACWGSQYSTDVPSGLGGVTQLDAGRGHTCAVDEAHTLTCWGYDFYGQATVPVDLGEVKQVSAASDYTCAIRSDDSLDCWGRNLNGQLNLPSDLGPVAQVSAGTAGVCAVRLDGTVVCWGWWGYTTGVPAVPSDLGKVTQLSTGAVHVCVLEEGGSLVCWGDNSWGQSDPTADFTAPVLSLPGWFSVGASSPDGAIVTFSATATDDFDGPVPVTCSPASGSFFPMGQTTVYCNAIDSALNESKGYFRVTVLTAAEQLDALSATVDALFLDAPVGNSLTTKIASAQKSLDKDNIPATCSQLDDLLSQIADFESAGKLTADQAADLTADVTRIRGALGC